MFARSTLEEERRRIGRTSSSLFSRDAGEKKKSGGGCSSSSGGGQQSSSSPGQSDGTSPKELGDVTMEDVDTSLNEMCKKVYTVYRAVEREYKCPIAHRDNVAD